MSDTNRFNRDTMFRLLDVRGERQRLRNAAPARKLSIFGMPVQWEEQPFEWVRPTRFGVARSYSKGPDRGVESPSRIVAKALKAAHISLTSFGPDRNRCWASSSFQLQIGLPASREIS